MYHSEKKMKQEYQKLKSVYDTVLEENGELMIQIEYLNNENNEHQYQISKAFSVSHDEETGSLASGLRIV